MGQLFNPHLAPETIWQRGISGTWTQAHKVIPTKTHWDNLQARLSGPSVLFPKLPAQRQWPIYLFPYIFMATSWDRVALGFSKAICPTAGKNLSFLLL